MRKTVEYSCLRMMIRFLFPLLCLVLCTACREDHRRQERNQQPAQVLSCTGCHAVELDTNHRLPCTSCHRGNNEAQDKDTAHVQLIARPAHPDAMQTACGSCHGAEVAQVAMSKHFTLANSTNSFRKAFGSADTLEDFRQVPVKENPVNSLDLADDLLRRRCFHCHPYTAGDDYPAVRRGVGCSACHLSFAGGKLQSHMFHKPRDPQCLSCHYGNYVGFDYYGRFEHDYNAEYRTPYTTREEHFRPYGVEYHQLVPDIHQQKGLTCRDCHSGQELMGGSGGPSCTACHSAQALAQSLPPRMEKRGDAFVLQDGDGRDHPVPLLRHPAHFDSSQKITCQACHAQWTFNDIGKHFLRSDIDDVDPWTLLATQGSSEVEKLVEHNSNPENSELPPAMTDKLSGTPRPGVWYKGFTKRRWEEPVLGRDADGAITTMRPLLDYFLSWVDSEEKIRFNSISAQGNRRGYRPYMPHTTGPAGVLYRKRIDYFIEEEHNQHPNETPPLSPWRASLSPK